MSRDPEEVNRLTESTYKVSAAGGTRRRLARGGGGGGGHLCPRGQPGPRAAAPQAGPAGGCGQPRLASPRERHKTRACVCFSRPSLVRDLARPGDSEAAPGRLLSAPAGLGRRPGAVPGPGGRSGGPGLGRGWAAPGRGRGFSGGSSPCTGSAVRRAAAPPCVLAIRCWEISGLVVLGSSRCSLRLEPRQGSARCPEAGCRARALCWVDL